GVYVACVQRLCDVGTDAHAGPVASHPEGGSFIGVDDHHQARPVDRTRQMPCVQRPDTPCSDYRETDVACHCCSSLSSWCSLTVPNLCSRTLATCLSYRARAAATPLSCEVAATGTSHHELKPGTRFVMGVSTTTTLTPPSSLAAPNAAARSGAACTATTWAPSARACATMSTSKLAPSSSTPAGVRN